MRLQLKSLRCCEKRIICTIMYLNFRFSCIKGKFGSMDSYGEQLAPADGIVFDVGTSSMQVRDELIAA